MWEQWGRSAPLIPTLFKGQLHLFLWSCGVNMYKTFPSCICFICNQKDKNRRWLHELSSKVKAKQSAMVQQICPTSSRANKAGKEWKSWGNSRYYWTSLYMCIFLIPRPFYPHSISIFSSHFLTSCSHLSNTNISSYIQIRALEFAKHSHIT